MVLLLLVMFPCVCYGVRRHVKRSSNDKTKPARQPSRVVVRARRWARLWLKSTKVIRKQLKTA